MSRQTRVRQQFVFAIEDGMLLVGKGANHCSMTQIGLNVSPGFTITTSPASPT